MKKFIMLACAALLLTSCQKTATDGYVFEKQTPRMSDMEIKVVLYPSLQALKKAYVGNANSTTMPENRELMAFSVIGHGVCTINMIDPKVQYMPEFFGHELTHCLYGEFHPHQNS